MANITPAKLTFKDADGDVGTVPALTNADVTLLNNALQDIENLKLAYMPGYVKRDFSNVTQDGKDASIGWVIPDYTAGISITPSTTNQTVSVSGQLVCRTNNWANGTESIYINDIEVGDMYRPSNIPIIQTFTFIVKAGDQVRVLRADRWSALTVYPFSGL